ncbi:hypothetical protein FQZ97_1095440 [compost metagenome]
MRPCRDKGVGPFGPILLGDIAWEPANLYTVFRWPPPAVSDFSRLVFCELRRAICFRHFHQPACRADMGHNFAGEILEAPQ